MSKTNSEIARQISIQEHLSFKATIFFKKLIYLQQEKPEFFSRISKPDHKDYDEFLTIIDSHLQNISTTQLLEFCSKNQKVLSFFIQRVFLQKEDEIYRTKSSRKDPRANWSDKLISLIGVDGETILNNILNHLGDPVRTKVDTDYKAAEKSEIEAEHSNYLEDKHDKIEKVMAEVADGIYNIEQLITLDPCNRKHYILFIDIFSKNIFKVSTETMLSITVAKYHHRMYMSNHAKNEFPEENELVLKIIGEKLPYLLNKEDARKTINDSFMMFNKIFPILDLLLKLNLKLFGLEQIVLELITEENNG